MDHIPVTSGSANAIPGEIVKFWTLRKMCVDELCAIGCADTNVNMGNKGGVIRIPEDYLQRPVQCFICLLHLNDLTLRQ